MLSSFPSSGSNKTSFSAIFNDPAGVGARFPVPVLQCLQVKTLEAKGADGNGPERFRIVLSDIRNYVQCMLATQANHVVHEGKLVRGCIVRLKSYQANAIKGKKSVYSALVHFSSYNAN